MVRQEGSSTRLNNSSTGTVYRGTLKWPLIHPFIHQCVGVAVQGAAKTHWEQYGLKCLAQGHNERDFTGQPFSFLSHSRPYGRKWI